MRNSATLIASLALVLLAPTLVSAHVTVHPEKVETAAFETFTVSVPNEKEQTVTSLRLAIPDGFTSVTPTVKTGWSISTKKSSEADAVQVTEVIWSGGVIPIGQRDDFSFSAKTPSQTGTVAWKAYQTYADGTVVAWDQAPIVGGHDDDATNEPTPYSETKVVADLATTTGTDTTARNIAYAALALALVSFVQQLIRKK
jgi:uncharacterized protein YcnI